MNEEEGTQFLNVDLEIFSRAPLDSLVAAFGEKVSVLGVRRLGNRRYGAYLETGAGLHRIATADMIICHAVRLVKRLPRPARKLWNQAESREFNIGIEAAVRSTDFELRLETKTVEAVASVHGRIVITVYAPERIPRFHGGRKNGG